MISCDLRTKAPTRGPGILVAAMLKRIKISGYKSFEDLDVDLGPLAVLFGPNGAGKSNFLDALMLLSRLANSSNLRDAFLTHRGFPLESFTFGPEGISALRNKERVAFTFEADIKLSPATIEMANQGLRGALGTDACAIKTNFLRYLIRVAIDPKHGFLSVADESLRGLTRKGTVDDTLGPLIRREGGGFIVRDEYESKDRTLPLNIESTVLASPLVYAPACPHIYALRLEFQQWHFFYFEPLVVMRQPSAVREVTSIDIRGGELAAYLNTLKVRQPEQFKALEKAVNVLIPAVSNIEVDVNQQGEVDLRLIENGVAIPTRLMSEGTLRILGLLAVLTSKTPPVLVAFEEPENGINPRRIALVAELLKNRAETGDTQLVVTTHSPILPDLIPDECLHVCRKLKRKTVIEPFIHWGPLARSDSIRTHLNGEDRLRIYDRILRGDFE